jgi:hypothetical protein
MLVTEYVGWIATAIFVSSYFFARATLLRGAQMLGAAVWMLYGVQIEALPVVVANAMVFSAAAWTAAKDRTRDVRERSFESH